MEAIEAVAREGGVVRNLPFEVGTRVRVTSEEKPSMSQEEWAAHVRRYAGSLPDFEIEEFARNYPEPVEPLFQPGDTPSA